MVTVKKGIVKGYEDGSFKPDESLTRAQLCAILDRLGFARLIKRGCKSPFYFFDFF